MKVAKTKKHKKRIIGEQKGWDKIVVPADPVLVKSVPSPAQLIYQTNQYGAFLHYGPAVFMDGNFLATPDPKVFNPTQLDAEQWVLVAKSFGAKHLVFTAKHHNGFCNWPTKTTAVDVLAGGMWKTVAEGQSIGRKRIERFDPAITAERVRFRVVQANAIPSISAMMVYDK